MIANQTKMFMDMRVKAWEHFMMQITSRCRDVEIIIGVQRISHSFAEEHGRESGHTFHQQVADHSDKLHDVHECQDGCDHPAMKEDCMKWLHEKLRQGQGSGVLVHGQGNRSVL